MEISHRRDNNFDFLRQLAAIIVIFGHSQSIAGLSQYDFWGHGIASVGVLIFFGLSGYLVTQSWQRDPSYISFLIKRSLRIFPALAVCVLLTAVVLGPFLTIIPLKEYFRNANMKMYFSNIALLPRYNLPGVFTENTYPNAVNGSLWSLPVEFACYLLIALIAFGRSKIRPLAVVALCVAMLGVYNWYSQLYIGPQIVIWGSDIGQATMIMPFFIMGAFLCVLRGKIPLRWDVALAFAIGLTAMQYLMSGFPIVKVTWVFVPYIVLTVGWASTPVLRRFGRFGDPSYGMYLYAFPVQQTLAYVSGNKMNFLALTLLTTAIVVPLGLLSWHLLEKPALALKFKIGATLTTSQKKSI